MKTLILSDIHKRNPFKLIERKLKEGIDRVISLGDIDNPEILEEFLSLKIKNYALIGNHDYPFVYSFKNGALHESIAAFDWTEEEIKNKHEKWKASPVLKEYSREWLSRINANEQEGFQLSENLEDKTIVYLHGLLYSPRLDNRFVDQIWGSLRTLGGRINDNLLNQNFLEMQQKDYWIMFRGHDHKRDMQSIGMNENPFMNPIWQANLTSEKYGKKKLEENRRYLITIGAFSWGDYMVFDSETKELEFGSLD